MREVEIWVELTENTMHAGATDKPFAWGITVDGEDHGGGLTDTFTWAVQSAAYYVRDLESGAFDEANE